MQKIRERGLSILRSTNLSVKEASAMMRDRFPGGKRRTQPNVERVTYTSAHQLENQLNQQLQELVYTKRRIPDPYQPPTPLKKKLAKKMGNALIWTKAKIDNFTIIPRLYLAIWTRAPRNHLAQLSKRLAEPTRPVRDFIGTAASRVGATIDQATRPPRQRGAEILQQTSETIAQKIVKTKNSLGHATQDFFATPSGAYLNRLATATQQGIENGASKLQKGALWLAEKITLALHGDVNTKIRKIAKNPEKYAQLIEQSIYQHLSDTLHPSMTTQLLRRVSYGAIALGFVPVVGNLITAGGNSLNTLLSTYNMPVTKNWKKPVWYAFSLPANLYLSWLSVGEPAKVAIGLLLGSGISLANVQVLGIGLLAFIAGAGTNSLILETLTQRHKHAEIKGILQLIKHTLNGQPGGATDIETLLQAIQRGVKKYNTKEANFQQRVYHRALTIAKLKLQARGATVPADAELIPPPQPVSALSEVEELFSRFQMTMQYFNTKEAITDSEFTALTQLITDMQALPDIVEMMQLAEKADTDSIRNSKQIIPNEGLLELFGDIKHV